MYTVIGTQFGVPIYGDINGNPVGPAKDIVVTAKKTNNNNNDDGPKWWESLFDNGGEIFSGIGNLVGSIKGMPSNITYVQPPPEKPDNSKMMIIVAIVIVILLVMFLSMKK